MIGYKKYVEIKIPKTYKNNLDKYLTDQIDYLFELMYNKTNQISINDQRILNLMYLKYQIKNFNKKPIRIGKNTLVYRIY